jgi:YidC/Oxa1 family membrane protein insertase
MDRTGRIVIVVCMLAMGALFYFYPATLFKPLPPAPPVPSIATPSSLSSSPANGSTTAQAINSTLTHAEPAPILEQLTLLENDSVRVTFTTHGAAIKEVELKKHKQDQTGNVVLNEQSHENVMDLSGWPGADTAGFQVKEVPPNGVVYSSNLPNGVQWERSYSLGKDYTLEVKDSLTNTGATEVTLPAYNLSVGRAEPLRVAGHYQAASNMYLGSGWLASKFHLTTVSDFDPGFVPLIGIKTRDGKDMFSSKLIDDAPLKWLGVENQFFTVVLTPSTGPIIQHAEFRCFNERDTYGKVPYETEPDIEASAFFPEIKVPAGQTVALNYGLYAGPKDYDRLNALGAQQGELMNYGMFVFLIVPMLSVLHFWYSILHSYGLAIILLTVLIKAVTWPLQSIANRSGKRMQALAPKLKELQAKYKDQPEKLNTETFAMYREYGVNPFGGCLPALVQMPVFFSLYYMLQNAVELRGQSFLWVHDLTQPDTVFSLTLAGHQLALNPLPIMVTGLTMIMMRMTPQIGDPQQAKIAQFMPLIFLFIFYNFAAALSLYYVINNCVSIVQIYRNLRKPLPELKRVPKKKTA